VQARPPTHEARKPRAGLLFQLALPGPYIKQIEAIEVAGNLVQGPAPRLSSTTTTAAQRPAIVLIMRAAPAPPPLR
jgi:hypothetical protein